LRAREVHHRVPRHLLAAYDRMAAHPEFDGEGIGLALEFVEQAMRYGVEDACSVTREELIQRIEASCVELPRVEHREAHAADWREWGSWGGRATLARYGRVWFAHLAHRHWGRITAEDLARVRERLRRTRETAA